MTLPAAAARAPARIRAAAKLLLRWLLRSAAPAADMDLNAAAIDGTDRRTDGHPTVT